MHRWWGNLGSVWGSASLTRGRHIGCTLPGWGPTPISGCWAYEVRDWRLSGLADDGEPMEQADPFRGGERDGRRGESQEERTCVGRT
jgi:hypothetical protein